MSQANAIIAYLRDCYREDTRGGGVTNLLHDSVSHRIYFDEERFLDGRVERYPVHRAEGLSAAKAAQLYQRERELLYGVLPVVGRAAGGSRGTFRICAPLLLYPARLAEGDSEEDEFLYLHVDLEGQRPNLRALSLLCSEEDGTNQLQDFVAGLPRPPFDEGDWAEILARLETLFPMASLRALGSWPESLDRGEAAKAARRAWSKKGLGANAALAVAVAALVPRSRETAGVLFELDQLAEEGAISAPLRALFEGLQDEPASAPEPGLVVSRAPAVLSAAQERALRSSHRHGLTVVTGPPGTGKSYTLAALALDHVSRGRSVLVAARSEQALDVVTEKIGEISRGQAFVIQAGREGYQRKLRGFIEELLSGMHTPSHPTPAEIHHARNAVDALEQRLESLERQLRDRSGLEQRWGNRFFDTTWKGKLWRLVSSRHQNRLLQELPAYWQLLEEYGELLEARSRALSRYLKAQLQDRLQDLLRYRRSLLQRFEQALATRISSRQEQVFKHLNVEALVESLPLWTAPFHVIHRLFPLHRELFDLVIVDEATQCDLATCLPALQRAGKAVITGDPKQLRHISFLSRERQKALAFRAGLPPEVAERFDFRAKSLLDGFSEAVTRQEQVAFLDEHFRSTPTIIGFSNRRFYRGTLRVMTQTPSPRRDRSLHRLTVEGVRLEDGTNPAEAERAVRLVEEWVRREEEVPASAAHSLGVLSPFRGQVELLSAILQERLSLSALEKHRVLVGTPFAFQGEERDVMILSFVLDPAAPAGAFRYLERPDVMNVAVTRARSQQIVIDSLGRDLSAGGSLLREYLSYAASATPPVTEPSRIASDPFLEKVAVALGSRGFRTWPAFDVAGFVIDLVVEKGGKTLGIDLVGHPGEFAEAFELERCRMLKRAGLDIFPLPYSAWQRDLVTCLQAIEKRFSYASPRRPRTAVPGGSES